MTAKERADALQDALLWAEISGVDPRDKYAVLARQAVVIEQAIRAAQDEAYEHVARMLESPLDKARDEKWAASIRELKSLPEGKEGEGRE
jgi:hypothetical protein